MLALREKCRNTEFFLVRIFPHLEWIRRDTHPSVFNSNAGKYGPEKNSVSGNFSRSVNVNLVFFPDSTQGGKYLLEGNKKTLKTCSGIFNFNCGFRTGVCAKGKKVVSRCHHARKSWERSSWSTSWIKILSHFRTEELSR